MHSRDLVVGDTSPEDASEGPVGVFGQDNIDTDKALAEVPLELVGPYACLMTKLHRYYCFQHRPKQNNYKIVSSILH